MPWTKKDYPDSMKNLPENVRNKAIEISNALLEEKDMDEGIAIATGISRAKDWAENRGMQSDTKKDNRKTDVKKHGADRMVSATEEGWEVKKESNKSSKSFDTKKEAVKQAREGAKKDNASVTIKNKDGKVSSRKSYNPNNSGKK